MSRLKGCELAFRLASPISAGISRAADCALPHALRSHSWICSSSLALSSAQQHGWTAQVRMRLRRCLRLRPCVCASIM